MFLRYGDRRARPQWHGERLALRSQRPRVLLAVFAYRHGQRIALTTFSDLGARRPKESSAWTGEQFAA